MKNGFIVTTCEYKKNKGTCGETELTEGRFDRGV